jgi:hypothetical protein
MTDLPGFFDALCGVTVPVGLNEKRNHLDNTKLPTGYVSDIGILYHKNHFRHYDDNYR